MSEKKINTVIALAENYGRKLSVPAAKLMVQSLSELTDEQTEAAAAVALRKCKFMPAACELIEFSRTGGVSYEAQAEVAFEQLEAALDANKPSLMPPLVATIARQIGGFQVLREMSVVEFRTWKRKEFLAAYVTLTKENPQRLAAIAGPSSEIAKALHGEIKKLPSREEVAAIEAANRQKLISLAAPAQGLESE